MDMKPAPEPVSQRLKGQFAPAYLTLTSIIQGVALSTLAVRVEGNYLQFDVTDWLLTVATFIGFLAVANRGPGDSAKDKPRVRKDSLQ